MEFFKKYSHIVFVVFLLMINIFVYYSLFEEERGGQMKVVFLDVGQGDAVFIEAPDGRQMLIDGGANDKVLRELSKVMPFYDRSIDVVVATHPDQDHIGGLISVLRNYNVDVALESSVESTTPDAQEFKKIIKEKNIKKLVATRGMNVCLDIEICLNILFPDRDMKTADTNDASIVAKLIYKNNSFLFTGDSPIKIEDYLISLDKDILKSDVLKAGHHGSRTSTREAYLGYVDPEFVVISSGKDNRYGHPHKEVLDLLNKFGVNILRTDENGTIIMKSDGTEISI